MGLWDKLHLDMDRDRVVTLTGGGGKTTTMYAMAREAVDRGRTVIVTTTTQIMPHPGICLTGDGREEALRAALAAHGIVTLGVMDRSDKMSGTGSIAVCASAADVVLVEGDGARIKPLKVPADHEPVIPRESRAVVAVAGLDALDKPIRATCHRPERVAVFLKKGLDEPVTEADMAAILSSPAGGRKDVEPYMSFRCLLNKADTPRLQERGERIAGELIEKGIPTWVGHYSEKERGGRCWF